jgi:hypothetical protein
VHNKLFAHRCNALSAHESQQQNEHITTTKRALCIALTGLSSCALESALHQAAACCCALGDGLQNHAAAQK